MLPAFVKGVIPIICNPLSKRDSVTSTATCPLLFCELLPPPPGLFPLLLLVFPLVFPPVFWEEFLLFLTCKTATSVALAAIVTAAEIAATPATEPAPKVETVTATAATTTAATATTAIAFPIHFGHCPVGSSILTGLLKQYAKRLYPKTFPPTSDISPSALINLPISGS